MVKKNMKRTYNSFLNQLKSKRFLAACGATVLFTVMTYTTKHPPIEIATGITMILGSYLTAETIKPSVSTPVEHVIDPHDKN
jgi:hypothetical protein